MKKSKPLKFLLDLLFPPRCALCDEVVERGLLLCEHCAGKEPLTAKAGEEVCRFCGKPKPSCVCREGSHVFLRCIAPLLYQGDVPSAIWRLKGSPHESAAPYFAGLMAQMVRVEYGEIAFSFVTEVPMNEKKRRERGHNQAETLALLLSEELSLPHRSGLLIRSETSQTQHDLGREERKRNARESYRPAPDGKAYGTVLLVDDVMTTGATFDACAGHLIAMGAEAVFCVSAATTSQAV